jgi:hypothetical protein
MTIANLIATILANNFEAKQCNEMTIRQHWAWNNLARRDRTLRPIIRKHV